MGNMLLIYNIQLVALLLDEFREQPAGTTASEVDLVLAGSGEDASKYIDFMLPILDSFLKDRLDG